MHMSPSCIRTAKSKDECKWLHIHEGHQCDIFLRLVTSLSQKHESGLATSVSQMSRARCQGRYKTPSWRMNLRKFKWTVTNWKSNKFNTTYIAYIRYIDSMKVYHSVQLLSLIAWISLIFKIRLSTDNMAKNWMFLNELFWTFEWQALPLGVCIFHQREFLESGHTLLAMLTWHGISSDSESLAWWCHTSCSALVIFPAMDKTLNNLVTKYRLIMLVLIFKSPTPYLHWLSSHFGQQIMVRNQSNNYKKITFSALW